MKRRTLLAAVGTATAGLAGCLATGNDDESAGGDDNETGPADDGGGSAGDGGSTDGGGEAADDGTESTGGGNESAGDGNTDDEYAEPPSIEGSQIETAVADCSFADEVDATASRGDGSVTVEGVISAPNPCHEAVLLDVTIHNRQLVLRVDVESDGSGMCQECIAGIEYTATVSVSNVDGLDGATAEHAGGDEHATNWDDGEAATP